MHTIPGMPKRGNETFWDRLTRAYFAKHKIKGTQKVLAKLVGATQSTSKKWKAGGLPSMPNAVTLAEKLDVCVDWLYTGREPEKPLTADEAELLALFHGIEGENDRGEAKGFLRSLATRGKGLPKPAERGQPRKVCSV